MKQLNLFFAGIFLFFSTGITTVFAIDGNGSWSAKSGGPKSFIENKGQFHIHNSNEKVLFAYDNGSTMIYFTSTGVTYSFLKRWKKEEGDVKEQAREYSHEQEEIAKGKSHSEMEKEEHRMEYKTDAVSMLWENANPDVELEGEEATTDYHSYPKGETNFENIKGYKKLIYKSLYPNIDVEYTFHPESGIKYTLILHPGADISQVKMTYSDAVKINDDGDIHIYTKFGDIIDHAPKTYYSDSESNSIPSHFIKNGKTVSINIGDYDKTKTVVIDPWVQTPTLANSNGVWECEKDAAGNVYIIGGDMPMKLQKYSSAGVLQWTYNTPWDTANYWLGTLATDQAGNSYVTAGSVAKIQKVNTAGTLVWNNTGGSLDEFWTIAFNCDQTKLVVGGTRLGPFPPAGSNGTIFDINTATGGTTSVKKVGWTRTTTVFGFPVTDIEEVRSITSSFNARYYYLTLDTVGSIDQNFSACPTATTLFGVNDGYAFGYKGENYRPNNGNAGVCDIRANKNFVYTQNGTTVQKRNPTTGAVITSAAIPGGISVASGGLNQAGNGGIDIDSCGNVYVGSGNAIIKYDANLVLLSSVSVPFRVYDVAVSTGGNVVGCGATGDNSVASRTGYVQQVNMTSCAPMTLVCCDVTICPIPSVCSTAAPFNLSAVTPGGTWSGTGITNAALGTFSPSVSGPGTFVISYALACGTGTVSITVTTCSTLALCQGAGNTATVSGGSGPYTWQSGVVTNPCISGTGFVCGPFTVAGPAVTTWTTFATGTTATLPGTYPIQVIDGSGNIVTIASAAAYSALPLCASSCPPLTVNISSQVNVACFGASTGSFNASTTGGATPWDYTLMNGATTVATFTNVPGTQSFTGLPAGTYTLNVLDNNGCPGTTTITITQPAGPTTTAAAGPDQTVCGTTATLAGNTATVGTGAWTLVSGAGTITTPSSPTSGITGLGTGANVFQWTITNPPCTPTSDQVTITGVAAPTVANAGPDQTLCGTTATLAGNTVTTGTGTWTLVSGAGTITTPSSPTSGLTGLGLGSNVFQWTIVNAPCPSSSDQITINVTSTPTVAAAGPDQTVCGTTATLAGNTAVTGTGTWTLVSGAGTITTPSSPTSGITGLGVGANVFQWTITSPPCTPTSDQVTITGVAAPTVANAGPDQTLCGTTATLVGNTATTGTGTWTLVSGAGTITTPSSPTSGLTGLGLGANVFQWTIVNAPCPPSSDQITINVTSTPTVAAAGPDQTVCGTTATLAGNTATTGTGTWTLVSGAGTITTPSSPTSGITGLGTGANVFQWTITSPPCTPTSDQVTITGVAAPTVANAGPTQSACSTSAAFAGNAAAVGTGAWTLVSGAGTITTPSSPTSGVTGLGAGANVFMWTISNPPCPASTDTVTIINTGGPTTSAAGTDQTVCGTTATLAGNTPTVGTGTWTLVSGTGTITTPSSPVSGITGLGVGANIFQWTISNPPCPPSTSTVTIAGVAAPTVANAGPNQTGCSSVATLAGNTPVVGTGVWTLVSGAGAITTPSSPTSGVTGLGIGANVFMWTISNPPCTPSTSTVTITNTGGPSVIITAQTNVLCFGGTTGSATASASSGAGPYDYVWTGSSGTLQTTLGSSVPNTLSGLAAGTYTITVTDNSGCVTSTTATITQPASALSVSVVTSANATCGNNNGSATVAATGGTIGTGYTYSWAPSGGSAASASSLGANTYTITASDANGCTATTTVVISNSGGPSISISSQTNILCNGGNTGSATVTGSGGTGTLTYSWTGGGGANPSATNLTAGSYVVTVTDGSGCANTITVTITQPPAISPNITTTPATCSGASGTATSNAAGGTGSLTYSWSPGGAITSGITGIPSGTYSVTITDSLGCTQTGTGVVGTIGGVTATATVDTTINQGASVQLNATGGVTYNWSPPSGLSCTTCANPIATPTQTTQYCVTVDSAGCADSACIRIVVDIPCPTNTDLAVPNAFSPNNDGHNDQLCLKGWGACITSFTIFIYDRWGEKVFESEDPGFCWDGTFRRTAMDPGVFVYFITATFSNSTDKLEKKGNISLIR